MKLQLTFLLYIAVMFTSCDKEYGTLCPGCPTPDQDPRSGIVLNVHIEFPPGFVPYVVAPWDNSSKIVGQAHLELLDATTKEVVARKVVSIKGTGEIVDDESADSNTAFLHSSDVALGAPWGTYVVSIHPSYMSAQPWYPESDLYLRQIEQIEIAEVLIDCRNGFARVVFNY